MADPMSDEQLAEVRHALAAVPAPPWQWIGHRHTGPTLVTTHSGWQYILGIAHPQDEHGHRIEDDELRPVYGDLLFWDEGGEDEFPVMRRAVEMIEPRAEYDPDTIRGIDNPVARWLQRSAEFAALLLDEVDRLRAELAQVLKNYGVLQGRVLTLEGERDEARTLAGVRGDLLDETRTKLERAQQAGRDVEAERDGLVEQVQRVEALRDRWEAAVRDPSIYRNGGVEHAAALTASHLPALRAALDGEEETRG
ncbi:hypothetical protein ACFHW2_11540 [Actinomadura sp. LOL_016]|uniref:hypothetical protein n=1 Tax=unclassified Actinomadura TaxID=2626254 RepID=UPI003A7FA721